MPTWRSRVPPWARKFGPGSLSNIVKSTIRGWRRRARMQPAGPAPMMAILYLVDDGQDMVRVGRCG